MLLNFSSLTALALAAAPVVDAQTRYPITGVSVSSGSAVPLRKNINALQSAGGAAWDLYIRAMLEMHNGDPNDPLSFFQVAGIHGKPYIEWNKTGEKDTDGWQGYCPHGERLFLTWHRPYVMLYEQVLVATAQRLAQEYPERYRPQYVAAAATLRSPFWDWGLDKIPEATVPTKMTVNVPSGSGIAEREVDNPLWTFRFPPGALNGTYGDFDSERRARIFRCPSPDSYPDSANALLAARTYKSWVYDAFTKPTTFDQFASTGVSGGTSLEQIHNAIHWDGACGGQFLTADFSGFDPLFMLHHTNVDRFWAYWQAIQPDSPLFNVSYSGGARWSSPSGTTITPESPLAPFFADQDTLHTSDSVSNITGFGYTYEGLEYWEKTESEMQQDATRLINQAYSSSDDLTTRGVKLASRATSGGSDNSSSSSGSDCYTRFFVRISLDVEEVERPCSVDLYLGGKKIDGHVVMQQPSCGTVHGEYSLDSVVKETLDLGLKLDDLVSDIVSKFQVQITKHDGTNIPIEQVPSLKLDIEDVEFRPTSDECQLPTYDNSRTRTAPPVQKPAKCGCEDDDDYDDGSSSYGDSGSDDDDDEDKDKPSGFNFGGFWAWFKKHGGHGGHE